MAEIPSFSGGNTPRNLLGNGTNSSISDAQTPAELNAQSNTAEQQFSGMTTEERLKSLQSPLDQFLSGTSLTMPAGKNVSDSNGLGQTIPEGAFSPLLASLSTEAGGASLFGSVSDANPGLDDFVTSLQEQGVAVGVDAQGKIHSPQNHESLPISENAWNDKLGGVMLYDVVAPDLLEAGARPYPNRIIDGEDYQYVPYVYDAENDPSLAYYVAYNPDTKNIDWAVTPSQLDYFQEKESYARNFAAGFNPTEYELGSARVGYYLAQGRLDSAVGALAGSWSAAFQDRGWWLNTALSVSGGMLAREASPLKNSAATPAHNAANFAKHNELLSTIELANPLVENLRGSGQLPSNYVTKAQAVQQGWEPGKALGNSIPGGQLGGDVFQNSTNVLPSAQGRIWYEADVGLDSTISRAKQPGTRLLYSNDGLLYVTPDHYESVHLIGRWKD
jgi:hypothetical protein